MQHRAIQTEKFLDVEAREVYGPGSQHWEVPVVRKETAADANQRRQYQSQTLPRPIRRQSHCAGELEPLCFYFHWQL